MAGDFRMCLTFDDVLLRPAYSAVLPSQVDVRTRLTRRINLNVPLISAAMDTVTEYRTAVVPTESGKVNGIRTAFCSVPERDIPTLAANIVRAVRDLAGDA